jgi:hypothetical protein
MFNSYLLDLDDMLPNPFFKFSGLIKAIAKTK